MKLLRKLVCLLLIVCISLTTLISCQDSNNGGNNNGGNNNNGNNNDNSSSDDDDLTTEFVANSNGVLVTVSNGKWVIDGTDTKVPTTTEITFKNGEQSTGSTFSLTLGKWVIDGVSTDIKHLTSGSLIKVKANGNWFINDSDTTVSAIGNANTERYNYKHVVIVGVDGAGAWFDDADMPNVDAIFKNGATTQTSIANFPTISYQCWESMLTGVAPYIHGIQSGAVNLDTGYVSADYPTIFKYVQNADPTADLAVFSTWIGIKGVVEKDNIHREFFPDGSSKLFRDQLTTNAAVNYLLNNKPKLTFIQLDSVDGAGESSGFGGTEYMDTLGYVDGMIGQIYGAVEQSGMLDETLFIVTTDHGGNSTWHGAATPNEYNTFCGIIGKNILKGEIDMYQRDVASIACWALGVNGNDKWDSFVPANLFSDNKAPATKRAVSDIYDYIDEDKVAAGLLFDDYSVIDMKGNAVATTNISLADGYNGGVGVNVSANNLYTYRSHKFGTNNFAIASWIQYNGSSSGAIYSNKDWGKGLCSGFVLEWTESGALKFNVGTGNNGSRIDFTTTKTFAKNTWVHTILVVDRVNKLIELYANFELVGSATIGSAFDGVAFDGTDVYNNGQYTSSNLYFNIGADALSNYSFNGKIDDFIIFNDTLNTTEITSLKKYYLSKNEILKYVNQDKLMAGLVFNNDASDIAGEYTPSYTSGSFTDGYNGTGYQTSYNTALSYDTLKFGTDSFSISLWIKFTGDTSTAIYGNKDWNKGLCSGFVLEWTNNGSLKFNVGTGNGGSRIDMTTSKTFNKNEWVHTLLVVDRENKTIKLYANFELVASTEISSAFDGVAFDGTDIYNTSNNQYSSSDLSFRIGSDGRHYSDVYAFDGVVDDFLAFNDVLTDSEIQTLAGYYGK